MIAALASCAPFVAAVTLSAVIHVESGGNALAINVNGVGRFDPPSRAQAVAIAHHFIDRGRRVDIGLMQVDSENLAAMGYSVSRILDPCTNIQAGGTILARDYQLALGAGKVGQAALAAALSAYNTGNLTAGFMNGYVARYGLEAANTATPGAAPMTVYQRPTHKAPGAHKKGAAPRATHNHTMTIYRKDAT